MWMLPSHWEAVLGLMGHLICVVPRALGGVLGWPGPPVLQAHREPPVLRAVLGRVLCVGHVLPPSPKRMEIFLFSKISFQMCWNFLSVGILENLVLIVKPNANFFQTRFSGIPHPKQTADFKRFCSQGSSQDCPAERLGQGLAVCSGADWIFILTVLELTENQLKKIAVLV